MSTINNSILLPSSEACSALKNFPRKGTLQISIKYLMNVDVKVWMYPFVDVNIYVLTASITKVSFFTRNGERIQYYRVKSFIIFALLTLVIAEKWKWKKSFFIRNFNFFLSQLQMKFIIIRNGVEASSTPPVENVGPKSLVRTH